MKLKEPNEVLSKFKEFKALVKNQTKKIKILRSHNRGEYISENFNELCISIGIKRK